jgi:photosystem II stability/assembly factor-like uncharacterized protein
MRPIAPTLSLAVLFAAFASTAHAADLRNFEDAALHAVQFVDEHEGWAVGDEGVVWHSIDGGQTWERQPTGVRASLRSVHFLNPYTGWVAGRVELPGGGSTGVLLYTKDGGVAWKEVLLGSLPGLNVVRFVDLKTGYLAGDGSEQFPTGVFMTTDAGRSWQPLKGPRCPSWLAGDFDAHGGALAGAWNRLATVRDKCVSMTNVDSLGGRALQGLRLQGKRAVAVGQGGAVLISEESAGASWGYADTPLSREVLASLDLNAVHIAGKHYWAVGRPGSVVLHSPDLGERWELIATGQPLPLNGVFFRDEKHGYAVGELGTIVVTDDGGKTWQVRHRGGMRTAALFIHARAAGLPLDTVALLGGQEGYLTAALRVTAPDPNSAAPARSTEGPRLVAAVRQAGGAAAESLWQFPVPSHLARADREELVKSWEQMHGKHAADQTMLRQLVLAIRMWRPDVILTDSPDPAASGYTADTLMVRAVDEAFRRAADPREFPEQIKELGLAAWKTTKVFGRWEGKTEGHVTLDLTALSKPLEGTVQEFAADAASLLGEGDPIPARRSYRLLQPQTADKQHDLMEGIDLPRGGQARRPLSATAEPSAELIKAIRTRVTLRALCETPAKELANPDRLLSQLGPMLDGMPEDQAARSAHAAASQYARVGQWTLAREAYLLLADRYPTHPLALDAYRWLIRYNSSSEARRRHEMGQFLAVNTVQFGVPVGSKPLPSVERNDTDPNKPPAKRAEFPEFGTRQSPRQVALSNKDDTRKWYEGSLGLEPRLAAFGPLAANDPAIQLCLQAARRNLGDVEGARKWYADFASRQPDGPWRAAALSELWLLNHSGAPPKPVVYCRATDAKPFLDGKLDDDCWQTGKPLALVNAAGDTVHDYPTEVRVSFDKDYLYLAIRCFHPAGKQVPPVKNRSRDADLRGFDRVSVLLDLDRDYSTCFHLQIDQRGCVAEDCWGDKTWDPRWFVKVHGEATNWVAEAAIPLAALTGDNVTSGRAWAFNVVRTLPGRGVQAWSLPAEVPEEALRPEGMGLLIFAQDQRPAPEGPATPMPTAR